MKNIITPNIQSDAFLEGFVSTCKKAGMPKEEIASCLKLEAVNQACRDQDYKAGLVEGLRRHSR